MLQGLDQNEKYKPGGWPRHVTYQSDATNLVPGDTNGVRDIFEAYNRVVS